MKNTIYDYVVVGAGICGSTIAQQLQQTTNSILLIDNQKDVAQGASGAAGAFLSPLLGKPNKFKDLVTQSLKYSTDYYKKYTPKYINQCGTVRIPKDKIDEEKFNSYKKHMDFKYSKKDNGYLFEVASVVDGYNICKSLVEDIEKLFDYHIHSIEYKDNLWIINNTIKTKKLILTTGIDTNLIDEQYFNIRAVWGQRIDINTTTNTIVNYHKECSVSKAIKIDDNLYKVSIGATHHRLEKNQKLIINDEDTKNLLSKANNIIKLENINVTKSYIGARACSVDYFPIVGKLINSKETLKEFPYLVNGTNVQDSRYTYINNLYIINGVGGRGYVLAPFLAKQLFDYITNDIQIYDIITPNRLFKRWVKKYKQKDI